MENEKKSKKAKTMIKKIRHKSRLVVLNDDTFEEQFSMILSPLNVFAWGGLFLLVFSTILIVIIAFTPLREFIPGYADINTRKLATYAAFRADSLQRNLADNEIYLENLKFILAGERFDSGDSNDINNTEVDISKISGKASKEDSILRTQVENEERYNLSSLENNGNEDPMYKFLLFTPLKGVVSSEFEESKRHYGVDIVPETIDASVKATYKGVVIQASWTSEEGHVIYIQHLGNLVSVYKHNSVLLKKTGDKVEAGEAIAIVGNSGRIVIWSAPSF